MSPIILDLCGGTGAWSRPYKDAGYDVRIITLPDHNVLTYKPPDEPVHGILAAPPCTQFSLARTTAKKPRDLRLGMQVVSACLRIIWECRYRHKLAFWCLENPRGYLRHFLGVPSLTFHPYEFGDEYSKATDLWGFFKHPKKTPIALSPEVKARCAINNRRLPKIPGLSQSDRRAITPPGFEAASSCPPQESYRERLGEAFSSRSRVAK